MQNPSCLSCVPRPRSSKAPDRYSSPDSQLVHKQVDGSLLPHTAVVPAAVQPGAEPLFQPDTPGNSESRHHCGTVDLLRSIWPFLSISDKSGVRLCSARVRKLANSLVTCLRFTDAATYANIAGLHEQFPAAESMEVVGSSLTETLHMLLVQSPYIWTRLKTVKLRSTTHVDTTYLLQICSICTRLQHLSISVPSTSFTAALLTAISGMQPLRSLHLSSLSSTPLSTLTPLRKLPHLATLSLSNLTDISTAQLISFLQTLPTLEAVTLTSTTFVNTPPTATPTPSSHHPTLHTISLQDCPTTPLNLLLTLAALPSLQCLSLPNSLPPSLPSLAFLPSKLAHLNLSDNPLPHPLPALPHLTHLALTCTPPSSLPPLPSTLRHLSLPTSPDLTPPPVLSTLTSLTHLSFSPPRCFPPSLLSPLTLLHTLHIPHPLDRTLLPPLIALPHLRSLSVSSLLLWPALGSLPSLTSLTAASCPRFSDHDFADIPLVMPALLSLSLATCARLTNAGLSTIPTHLPHLTSLTLLGLTKATPSGCHPLAAHPSVRQLNLGLPLQTPLDHHLLQQLLSCTGVYTTVTSQ